ncbi:HlyD family type I secretion periplasmic adaptor subunit [Acidisphaera rubrifaciens]|uniref:Membrane fusion protein (MFP) family protein n=1 Tax=Acidisphaera rubrifaciens HS-AP3 TaxID=1231350 RepID=A0A0D6P9Y7_9PROT|nr:HlyD family type I secretion periplasmic adaptor subunit [Acidisphaera rubrifaciens]GAN77669.1 multidrug resistance efflux pump HlyD/EmrA/FusE [Acidisphaera rubrifaciens HS-AP3]
MSAPATAAEAPAPTADQRALVPVACRPPAIISAFQPDPIELEERAPPRLARMVFYLALALLATAVAWASLSSIDEVVAAQGKLITTVPTLIIQPLEAAMVRRVDVAAGDVVRRGQALVTLDPTLPAADLVQLRTRVAALRAQTDRLEAELDGRRYVPAAPGDPDQSLQAALATDRRAYRDASLRNYDEQIAHVQASLADNRQQQDTAARRLDTLTQIESMRDTLATRQEGSRLNLLLSRDARLEVEASLQHMRGTAAELGHELQKLLAERQAFIEDFRRTTGEQLAEARAKRDAATAELKKAELRQRMIVLTAPVDATVLEVAQRTVGSVVRESETLVSLVPRGAPLEAEVAVAARDVGHLAVGQTARVKLDAFPFQKYGTLTGEIRVISQGAFVPDERAAGGGRATSPIFRVRIALASQHLPGAARDVQLIPGMTVTGEMLVGRRRVITYFLYPLLRGLDESIREP